MHGALQQVGNNCSRLLADYLPGTYHLENQNVFSIKMHKIEIGKVGNFSALNENFCAEISDFFLLFCGTEIITSNPSRHGELYIQCTKKYIEVILCLIVMHLCDCRRS